ncbi:MAG: DNA-deoxyinosine glycosylase [Nevskiales bacterium]|nr:DNA-deoxyinosine glycosylase [Nevskiales bacterium]
MPKIHPNPATSFAPVARRDARVLILGSMPGIASLDAQQYYAHPRNAFWAIVGDITGVAATEPYPRRLQGLKHAGIALWDVLHTCVRPGSLDAAIVEASIVANDFAHFFARHTLLTHVFFNGAKAAQSFRRYVQPTLPDDIAQRLRFAQLPSTSPANASSSIARKRQHWQAVAQALAQG